MSTKGIDVSVWNGNVDFKSVKKSGVDFVIIRAGYGRLSSQKDKNFETYYANAKKAGLKVGAYWYSYAQSVPEAKLEANACLSCVKGKSFDLPIYFDMEESSQTRLGKSTLTSMAKAFCEAIKEGGFKAGIYSNLNWFGNYLDYATLKNSYSIWLAQWSSSKSLDCDVWQYSDCGKVSGISGNVDMNYCYANFGTTSKNETKPSTGSTSGNSSVKSVQKWLNTTYKTGLTVDGIYGQNAKKALVKALQTELNKQFKAGLVVDGIFGSKTKSAIRNLSNGDKGNLTKTLQGLLICNGYSTNGFDGIFGSGTTSAVKSYQSKHGLVSDGIAGKETFASLCK